MRSSPNASSIGGYWWLSSCVSKSFQYVTNKKCGVSDSCSPIDPSGEMNPAYENTCHAMNPSCVSFVLEQTSAIANSTSSNSTPSFSLHSFNSMTDSYGTVIG